MHIHNIDPVYGYKLISNIVNLLSKAIYKIYLFIPQKNRESYQYRRQSDYKKPSSMLGRRAPDLKSKFINPVAS